MTLTEARAIAAKQSIGGVVQHIKVCIIFHNDKCRVEDDGYFVTDWFDGSVVESWVDGHIL